MKSVIARTITAPILGLMWTDIAIRAVSTLIYHKRLAIRVFKTMNVFRAIDQGDEEAAFAARDADPHAAASVPPSGATPVLYAMSQHKFTLARALATRIGRLRLAEAAAIDDAEQIDALLALVNRPMGVPRTGSPHTFRRVWISSRTGTDHCPG